VAHIDLYFFYGVDVVLLNVELAADELPLPVVQELLYCCGRAYPAGWHADGQPQHSPASCEWLDAGGRVLAASDMRERDAFLAHVATRYLCSGHALVVVGDARSEFYACANRGVLAQFRHQHFLLFLIAHFQKATLLMASDQLAEALMGLDLTRPASIKRFKRQIRMSYVAFLSFTHRYWFHEVSEQAQVKALFEMCTRHLQIDPLYLGVKERIHDMNNYLDADSLRRQANTVVRLTVVTIFGLIGTVTTGFLGMNLLAEADAPLLRKLWLFVVVFVPTIALTMYTMVKSKRLSDFLDAVSDERLPAWAKVKAFIDVWRREPGSAGAADGDQPSRLA